MLFTWNFKYLLPSVCITWVKDFTPELLLLACTLQSFTWKEL